MMSWIYIYIHSELQPVYVAKNRDAGENETMELALSVQRPVQKKVKIFSELEINISEV